MSYWNRCGICGAHLDPGEQCTCDEESEILARKWEKLTKNRKRHRQIELCFEYGGMNEE